MSTSTQYIPAPDGKFTNWAQNLSAKISGKAAEYGVTAEQADKLAEAVAKWEASYNNSTAQKDAAHAAVATKDDERKELESFVRKIVRSIQADPAVTKGLKAEAGLPIHSSSRTPSTVPTTVPMAIIEPTQVHEHTIRFVDDENPHRRARPKGVMVCEIVGFVGDQHPAEHQFQPFGMSTKMSKVIKFSADDAGKTAWYRFRWVNKRAEPGPWSAIETATITG